MTGRGEEIGRDGLETVETGETSSVNAGWGDVCLLAAVGCECRRRRAVALHALVTRHAGVVCAAGLSQRPCVCVCRRAAIVISLRLELGSGQVI